LWAQGFVLLFHPLAAGGLAGDNAGMTIKEFQDYIHKKYHERDFERGTPATFMWFVEEVGELATALAGDDQANKEEEFADVFAWMCTLANINDVDLTRAIEKYTVKGVEGYK
jgi:NTP pyrophosphatase (non-canonical NTP hydrolase)